MMLAGPLLREPARSFDEAFRTVQQTREEFRQRFRAMTQGVLATGKPAVLCTIYDAIPGLSQAERVGLALFNEVVFFEAFRAGISLLDLRLVCDESADYAAISPIEPSVQGGEKIAQAICRVIDDWSNPSDGIRVFK
jgi:hypothetical protein